MKGFSKRLTALCSAAAISFTALAALPVTADSAGAFTIEGEDMEGATLWTSIYENQIPGYSGEGFAYLTNDALSFTMDAAEDGMYSIIVHGAQILNDGGRQQAVVVNESKYSIVAPYADKWTDIDFGLVRLHKGENTIQFINEYGYLAIDYVTVAPAEFPDLSVATSETIDPDATPETKALMKYLHSVFGKQIISGQQQIYGGGNPVSTTIRYDASSDKCVDSDGNEYEIDRDSKDTTESGEVFYWHCTGADGQVYTYNTQNRNYGYNNYNNDVELIYSLTGKYPAIQGFDLNCHNPGFAWEDGVTERMIDWAKNKHGIVTVCWHCTVPKDMSNIVIDDDGKLATKNADGTLGPLSNDWQQYAYNEKVNFVTANIMIEGTRENLFYNEAISLAAAELKKLQDEGIPVIFRPLHEAEGNPGVEPGDGKGAWFWWAKEGAEVYKQLWAYLQDKLMNEYGLHNLIWEQNLYTWSDDSALWYSGDDKVDIVAYDKYNTQYNRHDGKTSGPNLDAESGIFYKLVDFSKGNKMVAMAENSSIPSKSNMEIEHAYWLYFCPWYDSSDAHFVSGEDYQDLDEMKTLYNSDLCITLDELPADLFTNTDPQTPDTTKPAETTTAAPEKPDVVRGDADCSGLLDVSDAVLTARYLVEDADAVMTDQGQKNADMNENGHPDSDDVLLMLKTITNQI